MNKRNWAKKTMKCSCGKEITAYMLRSTGGGSCDCGAKLYIN